MKTVVITGAGGVLCGTLAKALAKQGHQCKNRIFLKHGEGKFWT